VPRLIVCQLAGAEYMLDSEYDEQSGLYSPSYKVYRLPAIPTPAQLASGAPVEEERRYLGSIPVAEVKFDETLRATFDDAPLRALLKARR
jgi:hypothetical protein